MQDPGNTRTVIEKIDFFLNKFSSITGSTFKAVFVFLIPLHKNSVFVKGTTEKTRADIKMDV